MAGGATLGGIYFGYQHGTASGWWCIGPSGAALVNLMLGPLINSLKAYLVLGVRQDGSPR